jgi:hypothetical protein
MLYLEFVQLLAHFIDHEEYGDCLDIGDSYIVLSCGHGDCKHDHDEFVDLCEKFRHEVEIMSSSDDRFYEYFIIPEESDKWYSSWDLNDLYHSMVKYECRDKEELKKIHSAKREPKVWILPKVENPIAMYTYSYTSSYKYSSDSDSSNDSEIEIVDPAKFKIFNDYDSD